MATNSDDDKPDGPFIRFLLYIVFIIGGAVVGIIGAEIFWFYGGRRHSYSSYHSYDSGDWLIAWVVGVIGAVVGAVGGFLAVYRACRDVDDDK